MSYFSSAYKIDAASPVLLDPIRRVLVNRYFEPNKVKSPTAGQRELFTALIASRLGVLREKRLTQITGIAAAFQDLHPTVEPSPDAVAQRGPEGTASK